MSPAGFAPAAKPTLEWREIPGFDGWYEVSNRGDVRSYRVPGGLARRSEPKLLTGRVSRGYHQVLLTGPNKKAYHGRHCLVMAAFVGPRPPGKQVAHNNGRRDENHLENLRYATHAENFADRYTHGTDPRGSRNPKAKLTEDDVRAIRTRIALGDNRHDLAKEFGVSRPTIDQISTRRVWGWLDT